MEAAGYLTIRAASSKGIADVVAMGPGKIRFISVKSGSSRPSPAEREGLEYLAESLKGHATVECWSFPFRTRHPIIEVFR